MSSIEAVSGALAGVKTAYDIASLFRNSTLSLQQAEGKLKFADLISSLAEVKMQLAEVQQTIFDRNQEILRLTAELNLQKDTVYEAPYYWVEERGHREGPFCQHCHDKDLKLIRLQKLEIGQWSCTICTNVFEDQQYVSRNERLYHDLDSYED